MHGSDGIRLQSAMEYLMTYGWAILAIAIVMVSLYSLGIFNTGSLQPTATSGSCQVVKTAAQVGLAGQCGNLIPKYVGKFNGNGYINLGNSARLNVSGNITVAVWINMKSCTAYMRIASKHYANAWSLNSANAPNCNQVDWTIGKTGSQYYTTPTPLNYNTWYFVTATYNQSKLYFYVNGKLNQTATCNNCMGTDSYNMTIGSEGSGLLFIGQIANLQMYNTSLDNTSIKALYQEGIGGAPIDIRHIVGWWPLNGNANDYSGNNNQGTPTNVIWNANWQSGYSQP